MFSNNEEELDQQLKLDIIEEENNDEIKSQPSRQKLNNQSLGNIKS